MAFLAVFAVVCLFSLFAPYSSEPRFGVGVSSPVCHAEIRPLFLKYRCSTVTSHFHLHLLLFNYVGKICTFTLDCCSLNFLKVMQCYVYIYRTKIKVICLNMRVAMCSLSRVSNGNMIQVSRLKMTRSCKCEFYESLHSLFWFLHSWICLCECQPALKISSFAPKHHQIYSPYCSLDIF